MSLLHLLAVAGSSVTGFLAGYAVACMRTKCRPSADEASEARAARWLTDRRTLNRALATCYAHWQRLETPFGLMIVQLNVPAGDEPSVPTPPPRDVVDRLIEALRTGLREIDQLWATGDAEVAVVLPATDLDQARAVGWRAQPIVRDIVSGEFGMEFTAGLAVVRAEDNVAMLVDAARSAARAAGATGADQICLREGESLRPLEAYGGTCENVPSLDVPTVPLTSLTEA